MSKKALRGIVLVVMAGLPLACQVEQEVAGQSATANVSPEQQKRLDVMKSEGPNLSLTVLPVRVGGNPFDRATEFVGSQLEGKGLKNIELGTTAFDSGNQADMTRVAASLGEFVKNTPITTGYALYAELNGQGGVDEFRTIVVNKSGELLCTDRVTPKGDERDLMVACIHLAERVATQLGLTEEMAKAATPGKMAAIMAERSGLPPEDETAPLASRQEEMRKAMPQATLVVFSPRARVAENTPELGNAADLAKMINDAGLCKAVAATQSLLLKASQADPNLMKVMWDLAREFREYVRKNPVDADYVLYADYRFNPQMWQAGFVHLIVCDRKGEWVVTDLRNSDHPQYQNIKPTSREDCDKILVEMLRGHLK